jgi:hypothetical protein
MIVVKADLRNALRNPVAGAVASGSSWDRS